MNKKSYDLYGIECVDLEAARSVIEAFLNITMMAHESGYRCGEYYRFNSAGEEHFILQNNYDDFEGEWTEEEYSQYPLLFYVSETLRANELAESLQKDERIVLLRHQEL